MASQQHPDQMKETHPQVSQPVTSAPSLSQSGDDDAEDGRFSVAEEQNFDQQSEQARHVGQAPDDQAEAMGEALRQGNDGAGDKLRQSIERSVPRGD